MNKKFIVSMLIVGIVLTATIIGTLAYFTATQTVEEAGFVAGTLDLDVRSGATPVESFLLTNLGEDYTMSGEKEWTVRNTGTLPGRLYVSLEDIDNINNGCNEPKRIARETDTIEACEAEAGRLGEYMNFVLELNGEEMVRSTLRNEDQEYIKNAWEEIDPIVFAAGEERVLKASWSANPDEYGNEIQADELRFNIRFELTQLLEQR